MVAVLLCSNLIGPAKVCTVSLPLLGAITFGAGNLFFPISYIFDDVLTEVYGYARARRAIWAGFGAMLFATFMSWAIIALPVSPVEPFNQQLQPALETVFGNTGRIAMASIFAYWIGDFANSYVLAKMKLWTQGRMLWTRTIGSTIVGEGLDSLTFYPVAFYGIWNNQTLAQVIVFSSAIGLAAHAAGLDLRITNDAGVDAARLASIERDFREWGPKVYRYFGETPVEPINVVFSKHAGPGFYVGDKILISPDDDEMLETWIHELTHHVTGHESSFFLKEGIATHVVEALFAEQQRVPEGWPNYGQTCDAWVNLFLLRRQMQMLKEAAARDHYRGFPPEQDFRSWQVYCIGGSFLGWLIRTEGLPAFRQAFDQQKLDPGWEQRWLAWLRGRSIAAFNPMQYLPDHARYRRYADRLSSPGGK